MARNETHFEYADRGATSVYKFRIGENNPTWYVWFEYAGGGGSLYTTPHAGPYDPSHPLDDADHADLESLLNERGTTREQWVKDLMAQFGERIEWIYP